MYKVVLYERVTQAFGNEFLFSDLQKAQNLIATWHGWGWKLLKKEDGTWIDIDAGSGTIQIKRKGSF